MAVEDDLADMLAAAHEMVEPITNRSVDIEEKSGAVADPEGGEAEDWTTIGVDVPCRVIPGKPGIKNVYGQIDERILWTVQFVVPVALNTRHRLIYVDSIPTMHILMVIGTQNVQGQDQLWNVYCEEQVI